MVQHFPPHYTPSSDPAGTAKAYADGVRAEILTNDGQAAQTTLTVLKTVDGKAQIASLGAGNEVVAYLTGEDLANGNAKERVFLGDGEVYIFEGLQDGSKITSSGGAYGFTAAGPNAPMPLGSDAFAFTKTFFYGFRGMTRPNAGIYVSAGPIAADVKLTDGNGSVLGQVNLPAFGYHRFSGFGNQEYILEASEPIIAGTNGDYSNTYPFCDCRLILPLTNDGITWPANGFMSSLYEGVKVDYYVRDGAEGSLTEFGPGSPVNIHSQTRAGDSDYEPNGATRFIAAGLISAYSGADSAGVEATPLWPVKGFVQKVALPLRVRPSGDGGNNGMAFTSPYEGTVEVYEWDAAQGKAILWETIELTRNIGGTTTPEDQLHPAAALIAREGSSTTGLTKEFRGGYALANVPIHCVINSEANQSFTWRGTSGDAVAGITTDDDECATTGVTPEAHRAEIRTDGAGMLRRRTLAGDGTDTWEIC